MPKGTTKFKHDQYKRKTLLLQFCKELFLSMKPGRTPWFKIAAFCSLKTRKQAFARSHPPVESFALPTSLLLNEKSGIIYLTEVKTYNIMRL